MIESDHKVNYEMAYRGACVQLDRLAEDYNKLLKAARAVDKAQNKYELDDALNALSDALPRVIGGSREMG